MTNVIHIRMCSFKCLFLSYLRLKVERFGDLCISLGMQYISFGNKRSFYIQWFRRSYIQRLLLKMALPIDAQGQTCLRRANAFSNLFMKTYHGHTLN